jgi:hypothetical protein
VGGFHTLIFNLLVSCKTKNWILNLKWLVKVVWRIEPNMWKEQSETGSWNAKIRRRVTEQLFGLPLCLWVRFLIINIACMKIFCNWSHFTVKQNIWLTFADRWKLIIEASWQTCAWWGSNKEMAFITCVINHCTNIKILGHHCWIWWLFRFSACFRFWN